MRTHACSLPHVYVVCLGSLCCWYCSQERSVNLSQCNMTDFHHHRNVSNWLCHSSTVQEILSSDMPGCIHTVGKPVKERLLSCALARSFAAHVHLTTH